MQINLRNVALDQVRLRLAKYNDAVKLAKECAQDDWDLEVVKSLERRRLRTLAELAELQGANRA